MLSVVISVLLFLISPVSAKPKIWLKSHSDGYENPVGIVVVESDPSRFFVVERDGLIKIVSKDGKMINATPFLDASDLLGECTGYCDERGLLGLVFHPNFADNGKFFINYTQKNNEGFLSTIVSQFIVDASDPDIANQGSEIIILQFTQPYVNHNGGDIKFGPDGYLYVASGDGGSGGDPQGYGQNRKTMLGKILRIDVDKTSPEQNYGIPPDNPFVSDTSTFPEVWAYGVRNPWRISFDMVKGDLYIADVGQNVWEEVNFQVSSSTGGQNYGWNKMEGFHCFTEGCDPDDNTLTLPILEYKHVEGACSITGGYVDRGKNKYLNGRYFYGDYCNGNIWATKRIDNEWSVDLMYKFTGLEISSFGQDTDGNVYVVDLNGAIYKLNKCKDNKNFRLNLSSGKKSCKWIEKKPSRIKEHCKNQKVEKKCRKTCGKCGPILYG